MSRDEKAGAEKTGQQKQMKLFIVVIGFITIACFAVYLIQGIFQAQ
jgi:hypothetical protein